MSGSKDGTAALWTLHATQWRHHLLQPTSTNSDGKKLKVRYSCSVIGGLNVRLCVRELP